MTKSWQNLYREYEECKWGYVCSCQMYRKFHEHIEAYADERHQSVQTMIREMLAKKTRWTGPLHSPATEQPGWGTIKITPDEVSWIRWLSSKGWEKTAISRWLKIQLDVIKAVLKRDAPRRWSKFPAITPNIPPHW